MVSLKQFALDVRLEINSTVAAGGNITVDQLIATMKSLPADADASVEISVTQLWDVVYEVGEDASETVLDKLEKACQAISPSCTATPVSTGVSSRRRALGKGYGTRARGTATFSRSLSDGNITVNINEIPQLEASGVTVTKSTSSTSTRCSR